MTETTEPEHTCGSIGCCEMPPYTCWHPSHNASKTTKPYDPLEEAWDKFFDDEDLVHGTSGNVIDNMKKAFKAGFMVAMEMYGDK